MIYILLACLCWAIDPVLRSFLLKDHSSFSFILIGEGLITLFVFLESNIKKKKIFQDLTLKKLFLMFLFSLFCSALPVLLYSESLVYLGAGKTILFLKLQQFIAFLGALLLLKESLKKYFLPLFLLALTGSILLGIEDFFSSESKHHILGYIFILFTVLGWGSSSVFAKILFKNISQETLLFFRFFFSFCFFFILSLIKGFSFNFTGQDFIYIFLIAFISGFIGLRLYYKGLSATLLQRVALLELSHPLFSLFLSWIFLHIQLTPLQLLGGLFIITSSLLLDLVK